MHLNLMQQNVDNISSTALLAMKLATYYYTVGREAFALIEHTLSTLINLSFPMGSIAIITRVMILRLPTNPVNNYIL